jgi:hypothetical protein
MIALLDQAIEAITMKGYLPRKEVIRLLDALYELVAFIEARYNHILHYESCDDMDSERWSELHTDDF